MATIINNIGCDNAGTVKGFNIANAGSGGLVGMGIGRLGESDILMKRKFRWVMYVSFCGGSRKVPPSFVKVAARPSITIEPTEVNFLNEKTWVPGKATWEEITVTYYDVATGDNVDLLSWIASVYDFADNSCRWMNAKRAEYAGTAILLMLDGCGNAIERWTMDDMWPTSIKFGELDYSSSDLCDIELTVKYSKVKYENFCGAQPVRCGCTPCGVSVNPFAGIPVLR